MRLTLRDLLFTGALLAGVVFLYALQNSPVHTPAPAPSTVAVDVPLPTKVPERPFDRYRQFGLPAATDMILYFPMAPAPLPRSLPALLKKL